MSAVLIVDEIATEREEFARALQAEGFSVTQCDSAQSAHRDIWEGTFIVVFIAGVLTGVDAKTLGGQLKDMAPEVETIVYSKSDQRSALVRKAIAIRDGVAAA